MAAPLTQGNAQGRSFTCIQTHSPQGYGNIINSGQTGLIWDVIKKLDFVKVYLWNEQTAQYDEAVASVKHLDIAPLPNASNAVGYLFRCIQSYTNSSKFTANALDGGSIVDYNPDTGKVKVQIPKRSARGWTDLRRLHVGRARKYGDIIVETGLPPQLTANTNTEEVDPTDRPITGLLFPLVCSIIYQQGSFGWTPVWLRTTLSSKAKALDVCRRIAKGVYKAGLPNAYKKEKPWEWKQFVQHGVKITKSTKGQGLYARFYSNFKTGSMLSGSDARIYVGKTTVGFGHRNADHDDATYDPDNEDYNSGHYRIARQANKREDIVLVYLEDFSEREISIAEQAFILVLRAYRPEVITWVPKMSSGEAIKADADNNKDAPPELVSNFDALEAATQLTQLAEDLWSKLGWSKRLGTSGGCNKASPLASGSDNERMLWIMVDYPDRYVYYRSPYKPMYSKVDNQVILFGKGIRSAAGEEAIFEIRV